MRQLNLVQNKVNDIINKKQLKIVTKIIVVTKTFPLNKIIPPPKEFKFDPSTLTSLQKGEGVKDLYNIYFPVKSFNDEIDDDSDVFIDTAAIIVNCDLIIT